MEIGDLLRRAAVLLGYAPALTCGDRTLTFREIDSATDRLGHALLRKGLRPGERVGVLMPNGIDGLLAYYALAKAGLVRVSLNVRDTADDHEFRLRDSGCRALISERAGPAAAVEMFFGLDDLARLMADEPEGPCEVPRDAEAPYRLGYTGGTTGQPKAVTLSMRSEHAEITNYLRNLFPDIEPGDVMVHAAPVTHASGSFFLPHLIRGAHNVVLPSFEPGILLEELERRRAAATFLVPTMLAMVLDDPNVADVRLPALRLLRLRRVAHRPVRRGPGPGGVRRGAGPDLRAVRGADDDHAAPPGRARPGRQRRDVPTRWWRSGWWTRPTVSCRPGRAARSSGQILMSGY